MKCLRGSRTTFFLLVVSVTLSGCTPEKARSLRIAVVQFKAESSAAIKVIEEMASARTRIAATGAGGGT